MKSWTTFAGPIGNNAAQSYLSHSLLRYFGKLPPVLTGQIIDKFARGSAGTAPVILDLMCGSGTTLVESQARHYRSIGVDVNPAALLASRVKTRRLVAPELARSLSKLEAFSPRRLTSHVDRWPEDMRSLLPTFPNRDRWFPLSVQSELVQTRRWILDNVRSPAAREFFLLAWIGIIRAASRASVRTGRIFFDASKPEQNAFALFLERARKNLSILASIPPEHFATPACVVEGDARTITLREDIPVDLTLIHPPYFALYKYSSDVLRFELEWMQQSRRAVAKQEIEDGFKTTRAELYKLHVRDVTSVIANGMRHTRAGGAVVVVIGNSTLSEKQLPIVSDLLTLCASQGMPAEDVYSRDIGHSQVTYHKSANSNIRSDADVVVVFRVA